mgnify:FL=1
MVNSITDQIIPEIKEIYAYLYSQGFNKTITHMNIEDIQQFYQLQMLDLEIT